MGELFDSSLSVSHWSDRAGKQVPLGEIALNENEIVSSQAIEEWEPSREDFEGFTGNAGMTLERWCHRAAVVVWPRSQHFRILCNAGTDSAIGGLDTMIKSLEKLKRAKRTKSNDEKIRTLKGDCTDFANSIIDSWQFGSRYSNSQMGDAAKAIDRKLFCDALCSLENAEIINRYISVAMARPDSPFNTKLVRQCKAIGWEHFTNSLKETFRVANSRVITRNAELLQAISELRDKDSVRIELCHTLGTNLVEALKKFDVPSDQRRYHEELDRTALLVAFNKAMLAVEGHQPLKQLIDHVLGGVSQSLVIEPDEIDDELDVEFEPTGDSSKYGLTSVQLAAISKLKLTISQIASAPSIKRWLTVCRKRLQELTAAKPRPPADFRRQSDTGCNCADCKTLSSFLADPSIESVRLPLAKQRRQHLHRVIDGKRLDCTHVTQHIGSPHVLVCTKTNASCDAADKIYNCDAANLKSIETLLSL